MSDPVPTPSEPRPDPSTPPPTRPPKPKRRVPIWARVVAGLFLFVLVLVLLAPTIAGTSPVRSFLLGKVNANLNGRVEVADWSLGWFSGLKASGVRVTDAGGGEMLTLARLETDLTVLDLVRAQYSLGDAVVDGLDVQIRRDADGEFNFSKLAKPRAETPSPAPPEPSPSPSPTPTEAKPTKLPDLSGRIAVRNSRGTFKDVARNHVVEFPRIEGAVNIPSINEPVVHELVIDTVAGGKTGRFRVKGTADLVESNEIRIESASVDEIVKVEGIDLAVVGAFLPPGGIDRISGTTFAGITVKSAPGQPAVVSVDMQTTSLGVSGPALHGDTFRAREVNFSVPPTTIDTSPGLGGAWASWPIRTGGGAGKAMPISIIMKHDGYEDVIELGVNATPQALMNVAANVKPGSAGEVRLHAVLNVGGLAKQLPGVFAVHDGRRLNSGRLEQSAAVTLAPDSTSVQQTLDLKDLTVAGPGGAVEPLQPVRQELRFNSLGGGWAMPDLRDLRLALDSGFAKVEFAGKELTQLTGTAEGDLAKARRDLGPVLPALAAMNLAGTFRAELRSAGDVTSATAPIDVSLLATLAGVRVDDVFVQYARLDGGAKVVRGARGIEALDGVRVTARAGPGERETPTLDAQLSADVKYRQVGAERVAEVPRYTIDRLNVDLAAAQRDFAPPTSGDDAYKVNGGTLALAGSGSHTPAATTFELKGGVKDLNLARGAAAVLQNYTLTLDAAGKQSEVETRVSRLNVADNQGLLTIRRGQGDILIPATGAAPPSGEVVLGLDLKKLTDLSRSGAAPTTGPQLAAGRLDGTLRLVAAPGPEKWIALTGQLDATGLTVRTPDGEPVKDERVTLRPSVRFSSDFGVINVDHVNVDGRLIKGRVYDTIIDGKADGDTSAAPLASVRKANAVFELPQLGDLHALWLALSPPEPSPDGQEPGRIRGGSANVRLTVGRQGDAAVVTPEVDVKGLSLGTSAVSKNVGDVTIRGAARLAGADALTVSTLSLKGVGADVRLEKPLVVQNLSTSPQLAALLTGRINLAELCAALEAWQGAAPGTAYPYAGDVTLRQELSTAPGGVVSLSGSANVKQFASTGPGGRFAEPEVAFANQVKLDPNGKVLTIDRLSFATETTGAARVAATGAIREYDTARRFENLVIDLDYDAKPLWDILRPLMDPETGGKSLEEFAMAGKAKRRIEIGGSYPADDPHAIRHVRATGGFALETLDARGLNVSGLDLRFLLDQGVLRLEHASNAALPTTAPAPGGESFPPAALCNGTGALSLHGVKVDLTGDHPRLNVPDGHRLVRDVSINPVVADTLLGRFVNPAFNGATQAKGILNVAVVTCPDLALDSAMQSSNARESGRAELRWSLDDLFLSQPQVIELIAKLKPNALNENGVAGAVRDGRVVIEAGQVTNDMTFVVDKYALKFNGGIGLAEDALASYFVTLPPELFAAIDEKFARHVPPEGYRVALRGSTDNWAKSVTDSILPIVADLGVRAGLGRVLDRALGGERERERDRDQPRQGEREQAREGNRPAPPPPGSSRNPNDPLEELLDNALGGERETDAEKAARRERTRAERREREAKQAAEAAAASTQPTTAPAEEKLTKKERERLRNEQKRKEREERAAQKKGEREKR